jgi:hypothetical protein
MSFLRQRCTIGIDSVGARSSVSKSRDQKNYECYEPR